MNDIKNLSKKFISVLSVTMLLLNTSCADKPGEVSYTDIDRSYSADKVDTGTDISSITKLTDNTYLVSAVCDKGTSFFITDDTFALSEDISLPKNNGDIREFCCTSDSEGNGYIFAEYAGAKTAYSLYTVSSDGEIKNSRDLDSLSALSAENEFFYIKSVSKYPDGSFCINTLDNIYLLDVESGKTEEVSVQQKGIRYLLNTDDNLYFLSTEDTTNEYRIDAENNAISDEIGSFEGTLVAEPFYDSKNKSIYLPLTGGIDMVSSSGNVLHILKWSEIGISASEIGCCAVGDNEDIYILTKNSELYRLSVSDSDAPARKEISLYLMNDEYHFEQLATAFNKVQDEYVVTCTKPGNTDDANMESDLLIVSGSYPDIFVSNDNEHFHILEQNGLFTDLYTLMDDQLKKEDILPNIRSMAETDGRLYSLPLSFSVITYSADNSTGLGENLSNSELMEYFNAHNDINLIRTDEDRMDVFGLFRYSIYDFIDRSNASCSFESPEFIELLDFCSGFPAIKQNSGMDLSSDPTQELSALRNKEILLKENLLYDIRDLSMIQNKYFGCDTVFTGFPSLKGCGACAQFSDMMSITDTSGVKEGAWEFMKFILNSEDQERYYSTPGMSVTEKIFQTQCSDAQKYTHYYDSQGNKIYNDTVHTEVIDEKEIVIPPLNEKETERMSEYIRSVNRRLIDSPEMDSIIMEEITAFLNDSLSKEECAAKIQSRISLYLSEQY